jgi:membrane fusion protein (multidrug efflux system)
MRIWLPLTLTVVVLACAALLLRDGDEASAARMGSAGPLPVVSISAEQVALTDEIEALGTARANEAIDVTAKVPSLVRAINFEEGQTVDAGQVLVELEAREARAQLALAKATLAESRSQYQRRQSLAATQAVSASELDALEAKQQVDTANVAAAEARLDDLVIRAPFAGRLGLRRVSVGSLVTPGTVITTLDDTHTIKLDFSVPESFLATLHPGLAIEARTSAWPDQSFGGEVTTIDTRVDRVTRAITVRALIQNEKMLLRPGMFMTVRLTQAPRQAVVVPEESIVPERGEQYVWVVNDARAERRKVELGVRRPGQVEIVAGLTPGERVVTQGTQRLSPGSAVEERRPADARKETEAARAERAPGEG